MVRPAAPNMPPPAACPASTPARVGTVGSILGGASMRANCPPTAERPPCNVAFPTAAGIAAGALSKPNGAVPPTPRPTAASSCSPIPSGCWFGWSISPAPLAHVFNPALVGILCINLSNPPAPPSSGGSCGMACPIVPGVPARSSAHLVREFYRLATR